MQLQGSANVNRMELRPATNRDSGAIRELVFSVLAEYGLVPDPENTDRDLEDVETFYFSNGGYFGVVELGGRLSATVGIARVDNQSCELRKMYTLPEVRGRGLGKELLKKAIEIAKDLGYQRMVLETASPLKEAIGLYTSHGFKPYYPSHLSDRCDQAFELNL